MARIVLQDVTKRFGKDVFAVDHVSMEIADGEFMVLVGPSGCGKTTLLRIIAGLEEVTGGEVVIGEQIVTDLAPKHRDIAMVFQNYALYPHMTVAQNIAIGLKLRRRPKEEVTRRVTDAARVLGLEPLLGRKPSELSGGQRQRVAMGRAMVREPRAFLMDEPLSNLDAKLRVQMRAEIARLRDQLGTTTVYVTHDQVEAMTLGDRVAVMRDGVVQQLDTPQNLYRRPANMFVAAFIGSPSMNLFEAAVDGDHVVFGGHRLPVADGRLHGRQGTVVVGIRPSDFEDAEVWRDESRAVLEVDVSVVEELGAEANVIFALDARPASTSGGETPLEEGGGEAQVPLVADAGTTVCTACVDARTRAQAGGRVRLSVDPTRLHFFDAASGAVLAPPQVELALDARQRDPLDEHPLGEEEDHDHGQHEDQRGRHRQVPVDVVHRAERRQSD
jgi:multiple sugar transport system ATP-binding protein